MAKETSARKFDEVVYLRFEATMLGDIEKHAQKMQRSMPLVAISRSDAVRDLIARGLKDAAGGK